jgi:hypothetical protein
MLTRAQVARRLGKSIATVRRMEGVLLHPECDSNGVHQFDADDVDSIRSSRAPSTARHMAASATPRGGDSAGRSDARGLRDAAILVRQVKEQNAELKKALLLVFEWGIGYAQERTPDELVNLVVALVDE